MRVVAVRVLSDNYAYLLINEATAKAAAVDPAEPAKLFAAAKDEGVTITTVLTTHKHMDHAGGNREMARAIANLDIIGGARDAVQACTRTVEDEESFELEGMQIRCMLCPGHTQGHIAYYVTDSSDQGGCVFTGDCLFVGGAGKFFEGTGADMKVSLFDKLGKLPRDTKVWCGHEYTASNYKFALSVDPDNATLQTANAEAKAVLSKGGMTVPSTIGKELDTNPFMRADQLAVQTAVGLGPGADVGDVLQRVRDLKDRF